MCFNILFLQIFAYQTFRLEFSNLILKLRYSANDPIVLALVLFLGWGGGDIIFIELPKFIALEDTSSILALSSYSQSIWS